MVSMDLSNIMPLLPHCCTNGLLFINGSINASRSVLFLSMAAKIGQQGGSLSFRTQVINSILTLQFKKKIINFPIPIQFIGLLLSRKLSLRQMTSFFGGQYLNIVIHFIGGNGKKKVYTILRREMGTFLLAVLLMLHVRHSSIGIRTELFLHGK